MNAALLLYHLRELGVALTLTPDLTGLTWEASAGMVSAELLDLLREHKSELIELLFDAEERAAIQEIDGTLTFNVAARFVTLEGEPLLIDLYRHHPAVVQLAEFLNRRGGGVLEILQTEQVAA